MNQKVLFQLLVIAIVLGISSGCKKDDSSNNNGNNNLTEREKAIKDYKDNYVGSDVNDPGWTGSTTGCNAGTCSDAAVEKVIQRVNYFRRLVGLNDDITLNDSQTGDCQQGAMMMKANYQSGSGVNPHNPPSNWSCYTQGAAYAAGGSNIAWSSNAGEGGNHTTNAVTGYIEDPGAGNERVGHRRWLLYSKLDKLGHGSTNSTNYLMWKDNLKSSMPSDMPGYYAYPTEGYMPNALVFPRWSFSIPGSQAEFSNASVSMTDENGGNINLNIVHKTSTGGGYVGDNTIVWEPQGINTSSSSDVTYTVTISNISGANQASYTYDVTLVPVSSSAKSSAKGESKIF